MIEEIGREIRTDGSKFFSDLSESEEEAIPWLARRCSSRGQVANYWDVYRANNVERDCAKSSILLPGEGLPREMEIEFSPWTVFTR